MPKFSFEVDSSVPPSRMIAALTDFSDNRPKLWPTIDARYYKVHSVGETSADVSEGSNVPPFGALFGREHYDWSTPGFVKATVSQSNIAVDGGPWDFQVEPGTNGGSHTTVNFDRQMKGFKGRLMAVFMGLAAKQAFKSNFQKTLKILEAEESASSAAG
jgi:hypothetical protein